MPDPMEDKENQDPQTVSARMKRQETSTTPTKPSSPERRFWSPIKKKMVEASLENPLTSPEVHKIYNGVNMKDFFHSPIKFEGETVHQADLFDPDAPVYSPKSGRYKTNLERMEEGRPPIGRKGISSKDKHLYRIELHHVFQKKGRILEATHDAHMGRTTRFILGPSPKTKKSKIHRSNLTKKEVLAHLALNPDHYTVSNVLHFRRGKSLIDRRAFAEFRGRYWKARAAAIKEKKKEMTLSENPSVRRRLF